MKKGAGKKCKREREAKPKLCLFQDSLAALRTCKVSAPVELASRSVAVRSTKADLLTELRLAKRNCSNLDRLLAHTSLWNQSAAVVSQTPASSARISSNRHSATAPPGE